MFSHISGARNVTYTTKKRKRIKDRKTAQLTIKQPRLDATHTEQTEKTQPDKGRRFSAVTENGRQEIEETFGIKYTVGSEDQSQLVYIAPVNAISSHGTQYGLFAAVDIKAGEVFSLYTGKYYTQEEYAQFAEKDKHYAIELQDEDTVIDASQEGNLGRFANHASNINCEFYQPDQTPPVIQMRALKTIKQGQQILTTYGPGYQFPFKSIHLHASDNDQSTTDLLHGNPDFYRSKPFQFEGDMPALGINKDENAYLPIPLIPVFKNDPLMPDVDCDMSSPDLPILKLAGDGRLLERWEQERISSLMVFAYLGKPHEAAFFLKQGADPNLQSYFSGNTALHLLVMGFHTSEMSGDDLYKLQYDNSHRLEMISLFLAHGADLSIQNDDKNTALHLAIEHAPPDCLRMLLRESKKPVTLLVKYGMRDNRDLFFHALQAGKKEHAMVILECILAAGKEALYLRQLHTTLNGIDNKEPLQLMNLLNEFHEKITMQPLTPLTQNKWKEKANSSLGRHSLLAESERGKGTRNRRTNIRKMDSVINLITEMQEAILDSMRALDKKPTQKK